MERFNLNIDSYTLSDLMILFSLKRDYGRKNVEDGKKVLIQQLGKIQNLGEDKKINISFFIDMACVKLKEKFQTEIKNKGTWSQSENLIMQDSNTHYVISDPNVIAGRNSKITEGRLAGTDDVPPGWLNPINVRTIMTGMNIDSRFRDNYSTTSASNFQFDLPDVQKNVTNMRIATLDIPMTYYGVSRARGDSTFLVCEPFQRSATNMRVTESSLSIEEEGLFENGAWDASYIHVVLSQHPVFTYISVPDDIPLVDITYPERPVVQSKDFLFTNPSFSYGWLVVLPDGNYEMQWQNISKAEDLVTSMNTALTLAKPGVLFHSTGKFYAYGIDTESGMDPTRDLTYDVDRASGTSIFSIPSADSVFLVGINTSSVYNYGLDDLNGFQLFFQVDSGGALSLTENIQLRLGWQLGFRERIYLCTEVTMCASEGIAMVTGPRYMFISIDDGRKNSGNNFIAAFSQSTLDSHILMRINLASSMDDVGVYKTASDVGLSNQLNRTREYFGPVSISRLKIKLLDEYGRLIDLNHMDWSLSLVFEKLYE